MDDPKVKRRNNSLTQGQAARLYHWIEESPKWCATATGKQIAAKASEELKFVVAESNANHARRALGIKRPAKVAEAVPSEAVLQLQHDVRTLAEYLLAMNSGETRNTYKLMAIVGCSPNRAASRTPTLPGVNVPIAPGIALTMGGSDHGGRQVIERDSDGGYNVAVGGSQM